MAIKNAKHYISIETPEQDFWSSGEDLFAEYIQPWVKKCSCSRELAVEIGCGLGRLLIPASRYFYRAVGVDASREMRKRAALACSGRNIYFSGRLPEQQISFAYSFTCFQHIEDFFEIQRYLIGVSQRLAPGGIACFQFDTRAPTLAYRAHLLTPDFLLPDYWRRGMLRVRRDPGLLRKVCSWYYSILSESGIGTDRHWFALAHR